MLYPDLHVLEMPEEGSPLTEWLGLAKVCITYLVLHSKSGLKENTAG